MGVSYPSGSRQRFTRRLAELSKIELYNLIAVLEIPTSDRAPDYEWEHDSLRQRIVDWVYGERFEIEEWEESEERRQAQERAAKLRKTARRLRDERELDAALELEASADRIEERLP